ncbi:hypothetical protein [Mesorhizobium sp. M00.F.Ca.ET.216.01.1.1]|uniref:hypothetical protein n=1 Tax=Mesorhizobium sp. M00.F.Ca.ET.216.01.1.1 TaxID=2500528 RepID=UPI000FDBAB3C|nr:hypothetical protein [Mesorhizobium sp. M00.F.Ca.ET.216.01.1.1]TGQ39478.1 hypothetical protein EN859_016010 [Mesorhizobium sp. M00.F.Ca.ET.216.01.1.1]TJW11663.1 MAG: hypothetical protein E5W82_18105 [Mesorhizobium sp.]TJW43479.1 MAG: hypothetical protein E5W83_17310 [Mesorhizobium sp.]
MALSAEDIADRPALHRSVQAQSQALIRIYEASPRLAAVFATQQRWLMGHVGLALHFRRDPRDHRKQLTMARFIEVICQNSVASRNTAEAFVKEMLHYKIAEYLPARDGRTRPLQPTASTVETFTGWVLAHLRTLDQLDGGNRLARFLEQPEMLARLQPLVADGLLSSHPVREPKQTFSLFIWLTNGGIVMDWLMSGIDPDDAGLDRIPTSVVAIGDFAKWLKLSRTHLARKLHDAEELGSVGWLGQRGHSVMWVSSQFYQEYMTVQAAKLAIVDAAFETCFPTPADG